MKDFIEDRLEEDDDQALIPGTNGEVHARERVHKPLNALCFQINKITMKHKIQGKKERHIKYR